MEKTVKIVWEGKEEEVTLGQLTWGEHKKARSKSVIILEHKGTPMQFRDVDLQDDLKILYAIKKAPFEVKMESLDKLTEDSRYKLALAVVELDNETNANSD